MRYLAEDKRIFDDPKTCREYEEQKVRPQGGVSLDSTYTVRRKLDCSSRTLRRISNDPELGFPKPVSFTGRLLFHSKEIDACILA